MRRQIEKNFQQREKSHGNEEGKGGTRRDKYRVQTSINQTGTRPRTETPSVRGWDHGGRSSHTLERIDYEPIQWHY